MAARVASLAWTLAMSQRRIHDYPSLLGFRTLSTAAASCKIVIVVAQPFSEMTWCVRSGQGCSGRTASVLPACTICTSISSGPRSMLKATVNVVASFCVALQLGLLRAAAAPSGLMHREEAARGLVDVEDAVCADSVRLHEPAQLDEEPVRVGLLQSRTVELLQALGGLLEAQGHATQESSLTHS